MEDLCMQSFTIKQGDTFGDSFWMKDGDNPITGLAPYLQGQVRDKFNNKWSTLVIAESSTPGLYTFISPDSTQNWPLLGLFMDMQYTRNSVVLSSNTIKINVLKDVTQL